MEEALLPLVSGVGAGLLMARVWIASRLRRPRSPRSSGCGTGGDGGGDGGGDEVDDGTTAIIAPSSDRELAGRETGHRHAPHAGPLVVPSEDLLFLADLSIEPTLATIASAG